MNLISQIDFIKDGEDAGKLKIKVQRSFLSSYNLIAHPRDTRSVIDMIGDDIDDTGADSNIIHISDYIEEGTGKRGQGTFSLAADGNRDKLSLEWALSSKDNTSSLDSFNDLVMKRHTAIAQTGGLSGFMAL